MVSLGTHVLVLLREASQTPSHGAGVTGDTCLTIVERVAIGLDTNWKPRVTEDTCLTIVETVCLIPGKAWVSLRTHV